MFKVLFKAPGIEGKSAKKKAKAYMKQLTTIDCRDDSGLSLEIEKVDQMQFKPRNLISKYFDEYSDRKRKVWLDTDPQ